MFWYQKMLYAPDPQQTTGGVADPLVLGSEVAETTPPTISTPVLDENMLVTRRINGRDLQKPLGDWLRDAQKHAAGDDRLAEAARFKQETLEELASLQDDAEVGRLIRKAQQDDDVAAFEQALIKLNLTPEEAHQAVTDHQQAQAPPVQTRSQDQALQETLRTQETELSDVRQELEQHREYLNDRQYQEDVSALKKTVRSRVDSDDKLAIIVQKTGPRANAVQDMVWEAVERRISAAKASGEARLGPAIIDDSLAEVRERVDTLGIHQGGGVRVPGLASTPRTPADEFHREEPPKVVSVAQKGRYNSSIYDYMRHNLIKTALDTGG